MRFQGFVKMTVILVLIFFTGGLFGQGSLEDYKRAERFLQENVEKKIYHLEVRPNWIKKTSRFWYKSNTREGKKFILVDSRKRKQKPVFDHRKLAKELLLARPLFSFLI